MALKNNTWKLNQWYDQNVAGNATYSALDPGQLWNVGSNSSGQLGQNNRTQYSSPVQVPGTNWLSVSSGSSLVLALKTDNTLWAWGSNEVGELGQNQPNNSHLSSPVQVPGTTWSKNAVIGYGQAAVKTDGTLWTWGRNNVGQLGRNTRDTSNHASPEQVPGTTWDNIHSVRDKGYIATKTDGTLWTWGEDAWGYLGNNKNPGETRYSSPVQIPGTTWTMDNNGSRRVYSSVVMFKEV